MWLLQRGGDATVATTAPPAAKPAAPAVPAPLIVQVDVPAQVVAGRPATLVVHYADGAGIFSGSTEDWGDQVGTSSVSEGACPATAAAPAPALSSGYAPRHTWAKPGTYPVTVGVSTYTCVSGAAVQEQASTTVQVVVAAP